ncbi:MAG: hypothetical protein K0Q50_630 [Vampirovibrio sp.]|jgi:hypothetical protein|nr:hypothetical protein [Vampirovibrio sp.]
MTDIQKKCFVIAPIGSKGSEIRRRSDKILKHIINPVIEEFDYSAIRADSMDEPGVITSQIIQHILNDELVIADLTGHNPNVFYELAIRHLVRKPVIHLIQADEKIPFDVSMNRTIFLDHTDLDSVDECKSAIRNQIQALEDNSLKFDSPISQAIDLDRIWQKSNSETVNLDDLLVLFKELKSDIDEIKHQQRRESDLKRKQRHLTEKRFLEFLADSTVQKNEDIPNLGKINNSAVLNPTIYNAIRNLNDT